jgi:hypothetical protein
MVAMMKDDSGKASQPQMNTDERRWMSGPLLPAVLLALICSAAPAAGQFVTAPREVEPAHRGNLITDEDVAWDVEVLGLDEAQAREVEALAERIAETAPAVETGLELVRWCETLDPTSYMTHYPGASRSRFWFESHDAEFAAKTAVNGAEYKYFQSLYPLAPDHHATIEELYFAHICARMEDNAVRRPAQLRPIIERIFPDRNTWPEGLRQALAAHERERATIALELQQVQASYPHIRREAWLSDDLDSFIAAQAAYVHAQHDERAITKAAAARMANLLPEPQRGEFMRQFKRFHYRSDYPRQIEAIERALARPDLPDHLRRSLEALKLRAESDFDPFLDDAIEAFERTFALEWSLELWEKNDRLRWRGEQEDTSGPPFWEEYGEAKRPLNEIAQRVQGEFAQYEAQFPPPPIDPLSRDARTGAYLADIPPTTEPAWRFYYVTPVIARPEVEHVLEQTGATADQRTLALAMYEEYRAAAQARAVELGRTVTELNAKREELERDTPDLQWSDERNELNLRYNELDARWARDLTALNEHLWSDTHQFFAEGAERRRFERAIFDLRWDRAQRSLRTFQAYPPPAERHLLVIVEEAFAPAAIPAELVEVVSAYEADADQLMAGVERDAQQLNLELGRANRKARQDDPLREEQEHRDVQAATARRDALIRGPSELNARYRDLLLAAASDDDRAILLRAFDRENHPDLFLPSPIDLLARELEKIEMGEGGAIDRDRFDAARTVLDNARAQYERNTLALVRALKEWSGPESEARWARWREDHPPPDPADRGAHQEGPMDDLWDQRLDIAKNACATVARLFSPQKMEAVPAPMRILFHWAEEAGHR